MKWASDYPDVPVGGATLPGLVHEAITAHPDRTALLDGPSGMSVSYAELGRRIERIAGWLSAAGTRPGDTVALWAPNVPPWAAFALAAMRLGAAVTGLNPAYTAREAAAQLADSGATVALTTPRLVPLARQAGARQVIALGEAPDAVALAEVLAFDGPAPPAVATPGAPAMLPYSSGTTGLPKGVQLTHANVVTAVRQIRAVLELGEQDTALALAPFFHVLGSIGAMAVPLATGATVITMPSFDPIQFLQLIERHDVRFLAVPPPVAAFLAHHSAVADHDLSSLRQVAIGGAPLPRPVEETLARRLPGCTVGQGWGLTETTATITLPPRAGTVVGSVGRLIPNTELRVVDPDTGADRTADQTGELWVRGPQLMAGYLHRPDATADIIGSDGWLRTGDLGYVDTAGNVFVIDRLKELIKVDGFQVAPAELEALLLTHPAVADTAVIGRPDERHGELPTAFVVPRQDLNPQDILDWMAQRVAPHKRIAHIETVQALPRTPSGKLLRRSLRGQPASTLSVRRS